MTIQPFSLHGPIVMSQWGNASGGNSAANQFVREAASTVAPTTTEAIAQRCMSLQFKIWRLVAAYTAAGTQPSTMTARVNGVSQLSTATSVGAAAGTVVTDLAQPILVAQTALLSVLLKFAIADAGTMNPRAWIVGVVTASF